MNIDEIDIKKHVVIYHAPVAGIAKLQRLGNSRYGFVYLDRPDLQPIFVRHTAEEAMNAVLNTEKKKEGKQRHLLVGNQADLSREILTLAMMKSFDHALKIETQRFEAYEKSQTK